MNKHQIIEKLLRAASSRQWNMSAAFGGAAGVNGLMQVLPADMNKAIESWLAQNDSQGIRRITDTLHVVGSLTDAEYEQIMKAIDGEK